MSNVLIEELKIKYTQNADTCSNRDSVQELIIETNDGGGGSFFVIKTERWAFDSIDELIDVLKDFKIRYNTKTDIINENELLN